MTVTPDPALLDDLTGRVSGPVLRPADAGYDEARRVHNGLVDRARRDRALPFRGRRGGRRALRPGEGLDISSAAAATTSPVARSSTTP